MHVQGMLHGWFFIQGNVGAWLREMLKGKHAHVLTSIDIDPNLTGKAIGWCAAPLDADGVTIYAPPIDQGIHVPMRARKPVQGLFVTPTVKFLTQRLAEMQIAKAPVEANEAARDDAVVEVPDEGDEECQEEEDWQDWQGEDCNRSEGSGRKRRRTTPAVYEPVEVDGQLFPDGKYRGKYADRSEGDL